MQYPQRNKKEQTVVIIGKVRLLSPVFYGVELSDV